MQCGDGGQLVATDRRRPAREREGGSEIRPRRKSKRGA